MKTFLDTLFGLEGKVAVVIGGTGELCGAMAEGLARAGAVVVLGGRSEEKAAARLARIEAAGGKGYFLKCDLSSRETVQDFFDASLGVAGRVDILLNGAGVNAATPFFDVPEDELENILNVNLKSVFFGCQVFGKHMVERKSGSIINIGSMSGITPLSRVFTYSATKAAVHNLSKNLAREWGEAGVRVNTIIPGFFPAEQNRKVLTPERVESIMGHTPMNRFGKADELVAAALMLAADGAGSFITGSEIVVDGGYNAMSI